MPGYIGYMPTRHRGSTASWTRLQVATPSQGATPQTVTFTTQNCTPGSIIFVGVGNVPTAVAVVTVSDLTNGVYTPVSGGTSTNGNNTAQIFYVVNTASTKLTITVTSSAATNHLGAMMTEYSGGSTTVDAVAPATTFASTNTPTTPNLTTTTANDLLLAVFLYTGSGSITLGAGWTSEGVTNGGDDYLMQSKVNVTVGTYSSTCTTGATSTDWAGTLVAFKA